MQLETTQKTPNLVPEEGRALDSPGAEVWREGVVLQDRLDWEIVRLPENGGGHLPRRGHRRLP